MIKTVRTRGSLKQPGRTSPPWIVVPIAFVLAAPTPSFALCWIKRIEKTSAGVDVYFAVPVPVTTSHGLFDADPNAPETPNKSDKPVAWKRVRAVPAKLGDRLYADLGPENACSMKVVEQGGRIGVQADAGLYLPGIPPQEAHAFVPAVDPGR